MTTRTAEPGLRETIEFILRDSLASLLELAALTLAVAALRVALPAFAPRGGWPGPRRLWRSQ